MNIKDKKVVFFAKILIVIFTYTSFSSLYSISVGAMAGDNKGASNQDDFPPAVNAPDEFAGKVVSSAPKRAAIYKDPRLSCLLSFIIPGGGGHFYLRKDVKATIFCLGVSIGYLASAYFVFQGFLGNPASATSNYVIGAILGLVGVVVHIVSMVEAYNDAVKINAAKFYKDY